MRSPVPVNTSKRGEVADGIGGTRGMAGGARPPPPHYYRLGARFPPFPVPLSYALSSLSSFPLFLFLRTLSAIHTRP